MITSSIKLNNLHVYQIESIQVNGVAHIPPHVIWQRCQWNMLYCPLDRDYRDNVSGSNTEKGLTKVASIVQGLFLRVMSDLDDHRCSRLTHRPCSKRLDRGKKHFNAWFSILDNEKTLQTCVNVSSSCIRKKHFRPGGMAVSEWMRSARAVRDTPLTDYSAPGANTTHRGAYRPMIAVSLFLLALSVSNCKWTLCRCGQRWPYVGMASLGTWAKCKSVRMPHTNLQLLRTLHSSGGDLVPYSQSSGSEGSISTRHFVYQIRLCYSHKICYFIIWHALIKYLYICTYGQSGHRW